VLPFYRELENDLYENRSFLINSYRQHRWIANFQWYDDLRPYTPTSWFDHNFHEAPEGAFVVKGRTNSRKYSWATHMFARDKSQALRVAGRLAQDSMIGEQGLVYRKYEPLETLEEGLNGLPFSNEWRFFFLGSEMVAGGFYWSSADAGILRRHRDVPEDAMLFACKVASVAARHANFFVLDVAKTQEGQWILIEVNDGQMSGLSEIDPEAFYKRLKELVE
jgi:hypothetical protein